LNTPASPQRRWRADCPNCGAPVEFASAASPVAVCGFCRSTLAREGQALRRIGVSAELFDDHSPLQLAAGGRWQGVGFTVVGRLQLGYAQGRWNEWHALFDNGRSGWLAEDNGRYVMAFAQPAVPVLPARELFVPGAAFALEGRDWRVASVVEARVEAAQGELPSVPRLGEALHVVELRSPSDEVGALEFAPDGSASWSIGRPAVLAELALTGLRQDSEQAVSGRTLACPSCGNGLEIRLESTRSIVCGQCHAVVDVSQGVGGDLAHFDQQNGAAEGGGPRIPLGATGHLDLGGGGARDWQVVGYVERCTQPEDPDEDVYFWREYLLYAREVGFAFLVDAEDGWSWVVPLAGAPQVRGDQAIWKGRVYERSDSYASRVTWVLGEFYWRLSRGERAHHVDYAAGSRRLNREQAGGEVTWSEGGTLQADVLARAFALPEAQRAALAREVSPFKADTGGTSLFARVAVAVLIAVFVVVWLLDASGDECDGVRQTFGAASLEYQQCRERGRYAHSTSGGSYGGWSGGGGGHK
jgi:ribosomal protein S27AE